MNKFTHPKNESEEAAMMNAEEFKLDCYFLSENNLMWLKGDLSSLEEQFIEIINNVPAYKPTIFELCNIYQARGERDKLRQMIDYALKRFPDDVMFLVMDALWRFGANEVAAALAILEKLAVKVNAPIVMKTLGDIYMAQKMIIPAIEAYKKCVEKYDGFPEVHLELVRLYYQAADFLNVILELKHIPEDQKTLELKKIEGVCDYYREDYKAALAVFTDILKHHPNDIFSLLYAGDICLRFEKNYKAEFYWESALKLTPETLEDRACLAKIHLFTNDYEQAVKLADINIRQVPDHYVSLFILGLIAVCEDKFHSAAVNWNIVYTKKPEIFDFEFELIKKSLKDNKIKEFIYKVNEPEYKDMCERIKVRCDIK